MYLQKEKKIKKTKFNFFPIWNEFICIPVPLKLIINLMEKYMTVPTISNPNNYVRLDQQTFKKSAKRLREEILNEISLQKIGLLDDSNVISSHIKLDLSKIQECFSKSLGFKNYNAINHYFEKNKSQHAAFKTGLILDHWNVEEMVALISYLSPAQYDNSIEKDNALLLLDIVIECLVFLRDNEEILLSADFIIDHLKLNHLFKLYKVRRDFPTHLRYKLQSYFFSLPNFDIDTGEYKDNNDGQKVHAYSQMYFYSALRILEKIEKCDPIVISPYWYQTNYTLYKTEENNITSQDITYRLDDKNLNDLYQQFSVEDWHSLFHFQTPIITYNNPNEYMAFTGISLIRPIRYSSYLEDSWLADTDFREILNSLFLNKQFTTYYLSDLLFYAFKIINKEKRKLYMNFLKNILNKYTTIIEYSSILNDLAK